jgi:hypothetical protein
MFEIRVYGKNRDIPWPEKMTHIHLTAGSPVQTDDTEMVEHIRKFHNPAEGRGIEIVEIELKSKSVRAMTLSELRDLAGSMDVDYDDSDSRMSIMKKIRGEK